MLFMSRPVWPMLLSIIAMGMVGCARSACPEQLTHDVTQVLPAQWESDYCDAECWREIREVPVIPAAHQLARRAGAALLADFMLPLSEGSPAKICGQFFAAVAKHQELFVATEPLVQVPLTFRVRSVGERAKLGTIAAKRGTEIPYVSFEVDSYFLLRGSHGVSFDCQWGFWHPLKRDYHPTIRMGLIFELAPNRFVVVGRIAGIGSLWNQEHPDLRAGALP